MSTFDILEWVDAMVDGARPSAGHEWTATCPFCSEFGGFYVNTDPEGKGPWVCFKCRERSRSIYGLVAHVEGITLTEARAFVIQQKIEFRRRETTTTLLDRIQAIRSPESLEDLDLLADDGAGAEESLPSGFVPVWDGKRWRVPTYLTDRKFKRSILRKWGVGYCQRGFFNEQYFGHRVIIPIACPNGRSFTGRDLTDEQMPKYLNPKGHDHSRLLIGWDQAPERGDFTLVEGPTDAMKLDQHGFPSMGVGGKVLSAIQLAMLFTRPSDASATVLFDPEALAEAYEVAAKLVTHFNYVFVARLPDGIDPGKSTRKQASKAHASASRFRGERGPRTLAVVEAARRKLQGKYRD